MIRVVDQWDVASAKLAELIENGLLDHHVYDHRQSYIRESRAGSYGCCALGIALVGKFGKPEVAEALIHHLYSKYSSKADISKLIARELGVPERLTKVVEDDHYQYGVKAIVIIDRLRNDYYRKNQPAIDPEQEVSTESMFTDSLIDVSPSLSDLMIERVS